MFANSTNKSPATSQLPSRDLLLYNSSIHTLAQLIMDLLQSFISKIMVIRTNS